MRDSLEPSCIGCVRLPKCSDVTAEMVATADTCPLFDGGTPPEHLARYMARLSIIEEFGVRAVLPNSAPPSDPEFDMSSVKRPLLRKLALAAGLVETSPTVFEIEPEELLDILEPTFPNIRTMDTDAVRDACKQLELGSATPSTSPPASDEDAPAASSSGGTHRRRRQSETKPKEAPVSTTEEKSQSRRGRRRVTTTPPEETPEETPTPPRRGRGRATKPADKPPAKPPAKSTEETPKDAGDAYGDLEPIIKRLDAIGVEADKMSKRVATTAENTAVAALAKKVDQLADKLFEELTSIRDVLDGLDIAVTQIYNDGGGEEDTSIESVLDLLPAEGGD